MTASLRNSPAKPVAPAPESSGPWSDADLRLAIDLALRIALRWCQSAQDAEDVAQEAVRRLLLQDRVVRLQAWLAVVVRRLAWRLAREQQAEREAIAEAARVAARVAPADRTEAHCAARELLKLASPHDRMLLELDALGYSDQEIGCRIGCRPVSVHTLLSRARERLRRLHS